MSSKTTWVIAQDLILVIFEDMDPIWLRMMWEDGGSACADMIEILISLALLKLKSRLWFADLLWTMFILFILGCTYFLLLVWWPVHLVTIYDIYNVALYLWYWCVMFHLLSLNPIVFSKVFCCSFLVTTRKMFFFRGLVLEGHVLDGVTWDQLLVNWLTHRAGRYTPH